MKTGFFERLSERAAVLALGAFSLGALLPGLGSPSQITRGDVYRYYIRQVMGMVEEHSWLLPKLDDHVWLTKPPLCLWLMKADLAVFSNAFVAMRLPFILASLATVLLTYAFARRLGLGKERSALAGLLWLSCSAMAAYGRQPLLESPTALALISSFYGLAAACQDENPAWLYVCGLSLGLSSMIKWGVGPVTLGVFAPAYLAASGRWRWLLKQWPHVLGGLLLSACVALPWPAYILWTVSGGEAFQQLKTELISDRFKVRTTVADFLAHGLLAGLAPWTLLAASAAARAGSLSREQKNVLGAWALAGLLPTLMIVSRTSRYAFPALPAFCIAAAALLDAEDRLWRLALKATALLLAAALAGTLAACGRLGLLGPGALALGAAAAAASAWACWSGQALAGVASACVCLALLWGPAFAALGMNELPERLSAEIGARKVARFHDNPEAAGTGYLTLALKRMIYIYDEPSFDEAASKASLFVVSGSGMDILKEMAAGRYGLKVLDTWQSPHTNPRPSMIADALKTRSLAPLRVTHSLVELEKLSPRP